MDISLSDWKTIAEIAKSVATVIAIAVGGVWTYFLFVRNRLDYPSVKITIELQEFSLPNNKRLIHARAHIENVGKVVLKPTKAELNLRSLVPLPDEVEVAVKQGYDPVVKGETEINWPVVAGREWGWKKGEFEIEPEEHDTLCSDYIIDRSISVIEIYCFLKNEKKHGLGWTSTFIYELKTLEK